MKNKCVSWFMGVVVAMIVLPRVLQAGVVETKHGSRQGMVIVRQFDKKIVVTILGSDKRLYQYYGDEVKSITAAKSVLIARKTVLREEPKEDAAPALEEPLIRGLEVEPLSDPDESEWLRVRIWGGHEGWIPQSVLTDELSELNIPLAKEPALSSDSIPAGAIGAATDPIQDGTAEDVIDEATNDGAN